jgi:hypothetical protein
MSKLIALKSGSHEILSDARNSDFSNLKQQALLFDQIGIYKLSNFYKTLEESLDLFRKLGLDSYNKTQPIIAELEWLQQKGIVFELKVEDELQSELMKKFPQNSTSQKFKDAKKLLKNIIDIQTSGLRQAENEANRLELIKDQHFKTIRFLSIIMETTRDATFVTTFPYTEYTREIPNSSKSDVAQVVIKSLPLPSNETPWEQLIDYRNDTKTQKLLLSLRRWINKIATQNLSSLEIDDEIEFLINEFQEHMKFHKMKANTETIEVIINSVSDVLGNLLTLKFSKLLEPLFAVKKRQLSLLEAELNVPGKEMAYIIKSRETFDSQG